MSSFDASAYEAAQNRERTNAAAQLRSLPEFSAALDSYGRGPAVMLQCARGHKLLPIIVEDEGDHRGSLLIQAVPNHFTRADRYAAAPAEPWRHGSAVCMQPGCPEIINYVGWCTRHGSRRVNQIGNVRTEFVCHRCGRPVARLTTTRLLKLYGLAMVLGRREIPISDTPG